MYLLHFIFLGAAVGAVHVTLSKVPVMEPMTSCYETLFRPIIMSSI